jgi:AAA domain/Nuclease-related domain
MSVAVVRSPDERVIHPRPDQLAVSKSLNAGEAKVLDLLDDHLAPEWEIYVQPALNGLRPDFVCIHPLGKVVIAEVKDWTFDTWTVTWKSRPNAAPVPRRHSEAASDVERNPVEQILAYKSELSRQGGDVRSARPDVQLALIFPFADRETARTAIAPALEHRRRTSIAILGKESFAQIPRSQLFSPPPSPIPRETMGAVRGALVDKESIVSRLPFELTVKQRDLIRGRTESGYRRVRGAPGSGKSLVVAGRAAEISKSGGEVLVVAYNVALATYLRGVIRQFEGNEANITLLGFHQWCRRVMEEAGRHNEFAELGRIADREHVWEEEMPRAVLRALESDKCDHVSTYDAVLVDEGQDFMPLWWQCLRHVCRREGEMMLAADPAQNVYGRAEAWTDRVMKGSGFTGSWSDLGVSHRMPRRLIPVAISFAREFLPETEVLLPEEPEQPILPGMEDCELRWIQTEPGSLAETAADETERLLDVIMSGRFSTFAPGDLVLLVDSNERGRKVVANLAARGIEVLHTFSTSSQESQEAKRAFSLGGNRVVATSAHSFKGWEASAIVVCLARGSRQTQLALLYSAMTRLKKNDQGCYLTVVNSEARLAPFGRTWADLA